MKRWIGFLALAFMLAASVAAAQPTHPNIGLGFHRVAAPIGVRWWLSGQKIAIDFGIGFGSEEDVVSDEDLSFSAFDIGLPIMLKSWDRVHFMVRPGILYESQEVVTDGPPPPIDTDNVTTLSILGELEVEVFLADNVSFSAAHGLGIINTDFPGGGSETSFGTIGSNFTNIGFHVYLFGGQ
ncbi:MAG TPA: hypothetical protein VFQ05_19090 [Candidatus Eisenbacteria bacterium]|nr:hypothetical protein [Candidatus Eisenbacteria bacterium]